jgi:hypothetical protein
MGSAVRSEVNLSPLGWPGSVTAREGAAVAGNQMAPAWLLGSE